MELNERAHKKEERITVMVTLMITLAVVAAITVQVIMVNKDLKAND
jgi:hypothetical protein